MPSTSTPVRPSQMGPLNERPVVVVEDTADDRKNPPGPAISPKSSRVRLRLHGTVLPLRLFGIRVLTYLTNYVVAYVPSFSFRRMWYRRVLGIQIGRHVGVFIGTYVWFHGPRTNRRKGIRIGQNTRINRRCTLDLRGGLVIGENVSISPEVMILAASHDVNQPDFPDIAASIVIEDHAFIGTRAMILPGVTVGRGAVVVAGSQVSKDVPPMTIVGGTPARPIGMRDPGATAYELRNPLPLFE
jgi:acetyltransferase-like isoleucine patch superfamily enzyme